MSSKTAFYELVPSGVYGGEIDYILVLFSNEVWFHLSVQTLRVTVIGFYVHKLQC